MTPNINISISVFLILHAGAQVSPSPNNNNPRNGMSVTFTSFNKLQKMCNYSADKLIGYEHIVGLLPGAAADENTRLHRFRLHRGAALH